MHTRTDQWVHRRVWKQSHAHIKTCYIREVALQITEEMKDHITEGAGTCRSFEKQLKLDGFLHSNGPDG